MKTHAGLSAEIVDESAREPSGEAIERKRLEEELKPAKEYLEYVFQNSPDAMAIVDKHGKFVKWNKMAEDIYGYSFGGIKGKSAFELYADSAQLDRMLTRLRREGYIKKHEMNMKKMDGSIFPFEISISVLKDSENRTMGSVCVARDLSDTKKMLAELKSTNEQLETANARLNAANAEATRVIHELEETKAAFQLSNEHLAKVNKDLEETRDQLAESARRGGMAELASNVLHSIGNELNSIGVRLGIARENAEGFSSDIYLSDILGLLKEKTLGLHGHPHLEDVKTRALPFLETVIDDLTQFMNKMRSDLVFLQGRVGYVAEIIALQRSYAGMKDVHESVNVNKVLRDAVEMLADSIKRLNIRVDYELTSAPAISQNKGKLLQVFLSILKNAIEAVGEKANTEKPGREECSDLCESIRIRTEIVEVPAHEALGTHRCRDPMSENGTRGAVGFRPMIRVVVSDTGVGIRSEELETVFKYRYSTKARHSGFGLHECANYLIASNGSLRIESEGYLRGAQSTILLPIPRALEDQSKG